MTQRAHALRKRQTGGLAENFGLVVIAIGAVAIGALFAFRDRTMPVVNAVGQTIEKGAPPRFTGPERIDAVNAAAVSVRFAAEDTDGAPAKVTLGEKAVLPGGLSWNPETAELSGTPTAPGESVLPLMARDGKGALQTRDIPVVIAPAPPVFSTPDRTAGTLGQPLVVTFKADSPQGEPMRYHGFRLAEGTLPVGLRYDREQHRIAGVPGTTGRAAVSLAVTDSAGAAARARFEIVVPPFRAALSGDSPETAAVSLPIPPALRAAAATLTLPDGLACPGRRLAIALEPAARGLLTTIESAQPGHAVPLALTGPGEGEPLANAWVFRLEGAGKAPCTLPLVFEVARAPEEHE